MSEVTIGQQRVRTDYNPSADVRVDQVKKATADLIDLCERLKADPVQARCAALAQTAYEEASMWAVKALTVPKA